MLSPIVRTLTLHRRLLSLAVGSLMLTVAGCSCSMDRRQPEASAEKSSESTSSPESAAKAEEKSSPQQEAKAPADKTAKATADTPSDTNQFPAKGPAGSGSNQSAGKGASSPNGAGLSATGSSSGGAAKESSPEKAAQRAGDLASKAKGLEGKGDLADAYSTTLEAWELVRSHRKDARCQSLTAELARELERLGEKVNARSPGGRNGVLTPDLEIR